MTIAVSTTQLSRSSSSEKHATTSGNTIAQTATPSAVRGFFESASEGMSHPNSRDQLPYCKLAIIATVVLIAVFLLNDRTSAPSYASQTGPDAPVASASGSVGPVSPIGALGKKIFFDASLSRSGRMSCATCHNPSYAYGPPNGLAVQLGGLKMDQQGARSVPSLRYVLNRTPVWNKEFIANPAERIIEGEEPPTGGFGWDGRFNTLHDQAAFPLLAPNEMANAGPEELVTKLQRASYADEFQRVFGAQIFDDPAEAYAQARIALERFELEDPSFHPYNSKYDDYLDGKVQLSAQEQRGLALFDDRQRGNCSSCHLDRKGADGSHPLFTDYEFEALGVPRNPEILANATHDYFDMGLCGPLRTDQTGQQKYCGLFKTPTMRNVATRSVFFHNGRFHSLKEALRFYVRRDTDPRMWYPVSASGSVNKFDDLPSVLRSNIDVIDEPLTRREGASPAWTDAEIDDVIVFLQTLTDRDALRHNH
jgi:cytochrome c peroxidase